MIPSVFHHRMSFRAFRIFNDDGRIHGRLVDLAIDDLTPGDVVIRAAFSSVNYKDALAVTGAGKILRRFPLVGGIDVAGVIESSADSRYRPGDEVLVTGYDLGVSSDGGYAAYVRVPGDWVVPLPAGLSPFESMALGTAGFTAALSIVRLEHNGVNAGQGSVVVTGATGGVGSIGVACLSKLGYRVTAITGKDAEHSYLRDLGATDVLARSSLVMGTRPLEKATWAGAIDVAGGDMLAWLTRTTAPWGSIASTGLTAGSELHTTVMPFILRGVSLLGVDSVNCPMSLRREVWHRLATDMKPPGLERIGRRIGLEDVNEACATLMRGEARGRFVVDLGRTG